MSRRAKCFGCCEFLKAGTACRSCKNITKKPNDVRVSRELAQNIINYMEGSASSQVRVWRKQLIEQLVQS